ESAADMYAAVMDIIDGADAFISAAAVSDYRPREATADKIKKSDTDTTLALTRTRDINTTDARDYPDDATLSLAAETTDREVAALGKRRCKGLEWVAGNIVGPGHAFGHEENALFVSWEGGDTHLPQTDKNALAERLTAMIGERLT